GGPPAQGGLRGGAALWDPCFGYSVGAGCESVRADRRRTSVDLRARTEPRRPAARPVTDDARYVGRAVRSNTRASTNRSSSAESSAPARRSASRMASASSARSAFLYGRSLAVSAS